MALRNTLLLVDDAQSRELLRRIFEDHYDLLEAETGTQAVLLLKENFERIGAILLGTGVTLREEPLLRHLQRTGVVGQIPVAALVDWGDEEREEWALGLGAADLITRPLSGGAARKRIENLIRLYHGEKPAAAEKKKEKTGIVPEEMKAQLSDVLEQAEPDVLDLEIYRAIMESSGDVAFLWDMETDILRCSPGWKDRFGYSPICREASANLFVTSHFHPDDLHHLRDKIDSLRWGTDQGEITVRIVGSDGRYSWNRIRAMGFRDGEGELKKIIGVVADVDSDQRASRALIKRAERDGLTGMLNKDTARQQVEQYLEQVGSQQKAALLLVDLDEFKEINDRYGHMFGDAVLTRVAAALRGLFREKDILARIGGDEFMIFMRDIPDGELVERRCGMLLETLRALLDYHVSDQNFGCSVGFALMPDHGVTYQTLFQRADRALYQAKGSGKNTFRRYEAADSAVEYRSKVSQRIDSENQRTLNIGSYANFALERLQETDDERGTLRLLMEMIGTQMRASRIYLYENDEENKTCVNRFEWCAEGIVPMGQLYPTLRYDRELDHFMEGFNEQGVLYVSEAESLPENMGKISEQDGSRAVLIRAVLEKGVFRGFVGMDVCHENRLWTQEEIDALTFFSHLAALWLPRIKA